jgi:aspartate carbamoyltransferase catalytic subunit
MSALEKHSLFDRQEIAFPQHLVSIRDISRYQIEGLFREAQYMASASSFVLGKILKDKILGVMFFQASTRTRLSFEVAMLKLGGKVTGFADIKTTRSGDFFKEPFEDVVRVVGGMVDGIVVRHFEADAVKRAIKLSPVPLISAGDGGNEHPTQALCDLWVLNTALGGIDGARIGLVGDTECRVTRSTLVGLSKFNVKKIVFLTPLDKLISVATIDFLKENNISWECSQDIEDLLAEVDAVSMIPFHLPPLNIQAASCGERQTTVDNKYRLNKAKLTKVGRRIPILHCGPRGDEIDFDVDALPNALYFNQVKSSVYLRMALLKNLILS